MNELEKKLQAYRNREKRKYRVDQLKKTLEKPISYLFRSKSLDSTVNHEKVWIRNRVQK